MDFRVGLRSILGLAVLSLYACPAVLALSPPSLTSRDPKHRSRVLDKRESTSSTVAAPIVVQPSQYWDGIDGPWSSFALQLGQPSQNIRAFVSTTAGFTWAIGEQGCPANYVNDCANSRGFLFDYTKSLTSVPNSIYNWEIEDNLGLDTTGNATYDKVTLGYQGTNAPTFDHAVVFSIADSNWWLGGFGINPHPTNFTTLNSPQPSFLQQMRSNNSIPSLAYGYTAGNQYQLGGLKVFGSLILGGYDQNRFKPTNLTFPMGQDISRDLLVYLQAITTDKGSPSNLLPGGSISIFIDSSVPMIYLPVSACAAFEQAFGLTYDNTSSRYLVNSSLHSTLLSNNANVTFTLGNQTSGGETVDITLPYGAFDLQVSYPYVSNPNTSYYFPLQRAANNTQYTLGRTFLQEAYLTVDYDRQNFTVAPCKWRQNLVNTASIAAIIAPSNSTSSTSGTSFPSGAIAGVVVGIIVIIAILCIILWLLRRRRQTVKKRAAELEAKESSGAAGSKDSQEESKPFISQPLGGELGSSEIHELTAPYKPKAQELDSPYHMADPSKHGFSEMEGGEYHGPGKGHAHEMEGGQQQPIYEMAGSEVHEMSGGGEGGSHDKPPPRF